MKKMIRVFLLLITLVMWSSVSIGAQDDSAFSDGTKLFFDLDGDKKNEEIYINNNKLYRFQMCFARYRLSFR